MSLLIIVCLYDISFSSFSGTAPHGALKSDPKPKVALISIPKGPVFGHVPHVALILILKQEECNTPILHYIVSE